MRQPAGLKSLPVFFDIIYRSEELSREMIGQA